MRCRLSPDDRKLVISTTGGYLILINDLDLNTLARDLAGFRVRLIFFFIIHSLESLTTVAIINGALIKPLFQFEL